MEINLQEIRENYARLSDEEKETIRRFMNGPARIIIGKIFGEDFDRALGQFMVPKSNRGRGLAART